MDRTQYTRIIIQHSRSTSYYNEQEAAEHCQMDIQLLHRLHEVGLIAGIELVEEEYRYSEEDLVQLRRIRRLHRDLGVNLAGIQVILHLHSRVNALEQELEHYKGT